jgi:hypothetical protein
LDRAVERAQARLGVLVLAAVVVAETAQWDPERAKAESDAPEPPAEFPEGYPGVPNISEWQLGWLAQLVTVRTAFP